MGCTLPTGLNGNWLRKNYLFGINLTDDSGRPYPEEMYTRQICAAVKRAEHKFKIDISPGTKTGELHDIENTSAPRYMRRLTHRPVRKVTRWAFRYGDGSLRDVELDRVVVDGKMGGLVSLDLRGRILGIWDGLRWDRSLGHFHHGTIQYAISIDYQYGFDGCEFEVDAALADWIGLTAAMLPLDTAGDLIAGAGIANKSVSHDGLSQSLGTTASATNAGYGARIQSYESRVKTLDAELTQAYRRVDFMAF